MGVHAKQMDLLTTQAKLPCQGTAEGTASSACLIVTEGKLFRRCPCGNSLTARLNLQVHLAGWPASGAACLAHAPQLMAHQHAAAGHCHRPASVYGMDRAVAVACNSMLMHH
jgi:hypothetical protein